MTGRSAASAVTFLLTPIISRLYLPEHFGMAAVFLATAAIIGRASCAGYDKAINVARSVEDARRLVALCLVLAAAVAIVASPIVAGMSFVGVLPSALTDLGPLLWLLPVAIFLEGVTIGLGAWLLRHKQYKSLAASEIVQTSLRSGTRVISGFAFGSVAAALVWSYIVAIAVKLWVIGFAVARKAPIGRLLGGDTKVVSLPATAVSYSDFPRYNMVTGIMMQLTAQLPVFVFGAAFGAEVAGFFAMADRVMRAPINITTNALRLAVLQKLSEIWNSGRPIRAQLTRTVAVLCSLGIAPFLVFWSSGQELFSLVLGSNWATAGRFIEIMAPYFVVEFLGAPFAAATSAMRRQRMWFWLELSTAVARLATIPAAAVAGATPEMVLRVYVWATVSTKLLSFAIVYWRLPRVHPGFRE